MNLKLNFISSAEKATSTTKVEKNTGQKRRVLNFARGAVEFARGAGELNSLLLRQF